MKAKFAILAVITALSLLAVSCQKEERAPSYNPDYPYTFCIDNVSENASAVLEAGDVVTFDVVLFYLNEADPRGYTESLDNGSLTSIELTDGLSLNAYGAVTVNHNAGNSETVTVRLPHGYGNGTDMIKVLKLDIQ